jgi:hypothetical protein
MGFALIASPRFSRDSNCRSDQGRIRRAESRELRIESLVHRIVNDGLREWVRLI